MLKIVSQLKLILSGSIVPLYSRAFSAQCNKKLKLTELESLVQILELSSAQRQISSSLAKDDVAKRARLAVVSIVTLALLLFQSTLLPALAIDESQCKSNLLIAQDMPAAAPDRNSAQSSANHDSSSSASSESSSAQLPPPSGAPEGDMPPSAPPISRRPAPAALAGPSSTFNLQAEQFESRIPRQGGLMQPMNGAAQTLGAGAQTLGGSLQDQGGSLKGLDAQFAQPPLSAAVRNERPFRAVASESGPGRSLTQIELKRLADHEVVLLIDRSGSMSSMDCPANGVGRSLGMLPSLLGLPLMSTSRWNWCLQQTSELSRQTQGIYDRGITVVLFSSGFRAFPNVTLDRLPQIFSQNSPAGGTNLAEPLAMQIGEYFRRRALSRANVKPLMIGIITVGCPSNKPAVVEAVVEATRLMHNPQELTVIFFMIGGMDFEGERFVGQLSSNLMGMGAAFPIVKEVSFGELQQIGLAKAIAQKLQ